MSEAPMYLQKKIAEKLGIRQSDATYLRRELLKKDLDFSVNGRDVVLTRSGLTRLLEHLRATSNQAVPSEAEFSDCVVPEPARAAAPWRFRISCRFFEVQFGVKERNQGARAR